MSNPVAKALRQAAEFMVDYPVFCGCCEAIFWVDSQNNLKNKHEAKDFFQELYLYEALKEYRRTCYYWPCHIDYQETRIFALLLAAEILETGGL